MAPLGCDIGKLEDMSPSYLTKPVNMFPRDGDAERRKTLKDLEEIEELKWAEGNLLELEKNLKH